MYLGLRDARTQSKPQGEDGQVVGGIAFERTGVQPIRENTRAYSISTSYEKPTSIVAPCKNAKYYGEVTDRLQLCSDMVFVSFSMIVTYCIVVVLMRDAKAPTELMSETLDFLPPNVTDPIKMQADMMNILTIGSDKNYVWHLMQVNVSPAKAFGEGSYTVTFMTAHLIVVVQRNI